MRGWFATEDWWAVWLGLLIVALALPATAGVDLLGWAVTTNIWLNPAQAAPGLALPIGQSQAR